MINISIDPLLIPIQDFTNGRKNMKIKKLLVLF